MQKKINWLTKDLIGFSFTSLFNDLSHEMTTSLLPALINEMAGPLKGPMILGLITGCADALATFMKLVSGWLSDRITYFKPILIMGYSITPIFVSLIGTASALWHVFAYQVIAWIGKGLREPMRDTWLANISDPRYFGITFGMQRAFDTIGAILGPLLAFYSLKMVSIQHSFFIAFIPGFLSILCIIFLTSNYKHEIDIKHLSWKEQFGQLPSHFNYFLVVMFIFGISNFNKTFFIFRAQEMLLGQTHSLLLSATSSILLYVLLNCIRALAEFSMGFLSDYVNRRILLAIFGFTAFSIANILLLFANVQIFLWVIIFIIAGFSLGTVTSLEKSYAARTLPQQVRGTGFGLLQSVDGIGDLLSSAIIGALWYYISPEVAFIYAALLSFCAAFLFLMMRE